MRLLPIDTTGMTFAQTIPARVAFVDRPGRRHAALGDMNPKAALDEADRELVRRGLRMSAVFGVRRHEHFVDGLPWTCTLRYQRRRMTIGYYSDFSLQQEPTAAEVLVSLFQDAWRFQQVRDFVEFCGTFNYRRDSRRSEWTYAACRDAALRLQRLFDEDYLTMAVLLGGIRSIASDQTAMTAGTAPPQIREAMRAKVGHDLRAREEGPE